MADPVYCEACGEPKRRISYQPANRKRTVVWVCEQCQTAEPHDDAAADTVSQDAIWDAVQASFERR